jgi:RimJ/RimL family protein N-acetyltransferase
MYVWYYENKPIGIAGFDRKNKSIVSELTFTLNPKYWKRGFATEIIWVLIDEAFEMNIKRLVLLIHPDKK